MNTDNLKFFGTGGAEGYQPGSFWTAFMRVLGANASAAVNFKYLQELYTLADRVNRIMLNDITPGAQVVFDTLALGVYTRAEAEAMLAPYCKILPFLLSQFAPYQDVARKARNEAAQESAQIRRSVVKENDHD